VSFDSPFLGQLRAARAQGDTTPSAAPSAPEAASGTASLPLPYPRRAARPSAETRAKMRGHCGTCRHFTDAPNWGRLMGECALGWAAHEPWGVSQNASPLPVMQAGAACMCHGRPRWALRAGLSAADLVMPGGES
jgi:hypothetical protein